MPHERFQGLAEQFGASLYFLALRETRCPSAAEDVRNETLLRAFQALQAGRVRDTAALPGFVRSIARNVLREQRRHTWRYTSEEADQPAPASPDTVDHTDRRALALACRRLNGRERQVIRFTFFEELPPQEVASRLRIAPERVRLVKSRAVARVRELYFGITRCRASERRYA